MRHVSVLYAIIVAFLPTSATATKIAVVVSSAGAGSDKAAAYVAHYLHYFLSEDGRYEVIDNNDKLDAVDPDAAKAFNEAEGLVKKAMSAYETLELDPAADYLNKAVNKYEHFVPDLIDVKPIADALVLFGAVLILRGDEEQGIERIEQAITIFPKVEPDPKVFNPSMRKVFQNTVEQVNKKAQGNISITSSPGYAKLYVDGVFRGITPVTAEQLAPGRHYVRLVKDGYRSFGTIVTVKGNKVTKLNGALKPTKKFNTFDKALTVASEALRNGNNDDSSLPDDSLLKFKTLLDTEQLFAADVRLDGERVKVTAAQYDLVNQKHFKTVSHVFPYNTQSDVFEREISDLLRTQFGETTLTKKVDYGAKDDESDSGPCMGMSCTKFKKIALFGGIGAGVVLSGTGGLLYWMAKKNNNDYRTTAQTSSEAPSLRSSGKLKALIGDILVPLGAVAVATGVGLFFFYNPSDAPVGMSQNSLGTSLSFGVVPLIDGGAAFATMRF